MFRGLLGSSLLVCLGAVAAGCSSSRTKEFHYSPAYEQLLMISNAYIRATTTLDRPPSKWEELKPFIKELGGDPEAVQVSAEDGQPYVILWGVDYRNVPAGGPQAPVTAYEQVGRGGRRFVLRVRLIQQMTDAELQKAVFPAGHSPPTS